VPPKFVSNVLISGAGSTNVSTTTGFPDGTYSLTGFGSGAYTVTPAKTGGVNGISSFDAARIAQHVAGIPPPLSATQHIAADVSGNGVVSSFDAGQIALYVVAGPGMHTGEWKFEPANRAYPSLPVSITGQDYSAFLMGEVSGNWTNTGARSASVGDLSNVVKIDLPDLAVPAAQEFTVPVRVHGIANRGEISYEFELRYDPAVIQPLVDPVDVARTASRGLVAVANGSEPGILRVAVYGPMPIDRNGILLNVRFAGAGSVGAESSLTFERIMLNEGQDLVLASPGTIRIVHNGAAMD